MDFEIDDDLDRIALVKLGERLDFRNAGDLRDSCISQLRNGVDHFIFDFAETETLDSTGLSAIFTLYRKLKPTEGQIVFANVGPNVQTVVRLTSTEQIFAFYPDVDTARRELIQTV